MKLGTLYSPYEGITFRIICTAMMVAESCSLHQSNLASFGILVYMTSADTRKDVKQNKRQRFVAGNCLAGQTP